MPNQKTTDPTLAAGRLAYERLAWGEAYESLSAADAVFKVAIPVAEAPAAGRTGSGGGGVGLGTGGPAGAGDPSALSPLPAPRELPVAGVAVADAPVLREGARAEVGAAG